MQQSIDPQLREEARVHYCDKERGMVAGLITIGKRQ